MIKLRDSKNDKNIKWKIWNIIYKINNQLIFFFFFFCDLKTKFISKMLTYGWKAYQKVRKC